MNEDPRLSNLMTYTTFHIGAYISLVTALIGAGLFEVGVHPFLLQYSAGCILIAGFFGGTIGSNLAEATSYEAILKEPKLTVFFGKWGVANLEKCIRLEHFFFWLGILPPALLFILGGPGAFGCESA